jgi:hypothetical protein
MELCLVLFSSHHRSPFNFMMGKVEQPQSIKGFLDLQGKKGGNPKVEQWQIISEIQYKFKTGC